MTTVTDQTQARLSQNLAAVQQQMALACQRVGRPLDAVTLVAVTKSVPVPVIQALYDLGLRDFGESRPQQLVARAAALPADVRWHLIGHLQRNKIGLVLPVVQTIHSVDSLRLWTALQSAITSDRQRAMPPRLLLEVNVSGEASKDGWLPNDLRAAWTELSHAAVPPAGLMTMAPLSSDDAVVRPVFLGLRQLRDELVALSPAPLTQLSMGMTGDYVLGIEAGATLVRVGTGLFAGLTDDGPEPRTQSSPV
jgi:PLP dependent protein